MARLSEESGNLKSGRKLKRREGWELRQIMIQFLFFYFTWKTRIRWFVHDWSDLTIILEKLKNI